MVIVYGASEGQIGLRTNTCLATMASQWYSWLLFEEKK